MPVPQQLHFDVPWLLDEFFDKDIGRTKRRHRFSLCLIEQTR